MTRGNPVVSVLVLFTLVLAAAGSSGCGGDVTASASNGAGGGGSGGNGAGGGGDVCKLDPTGTFTFHVHNAGTSALRLTYGCGGTLPLVLVTPDGTHDVGPGPASYCEFRCDDVYAGTVGFGCSDCGPGYGADLGPGVTVDIPWDRRVYVARTVPAACSTETAGQPCAFGLAVDPVPAQQGSLTVCTDSGASSGAGYCGTGATQEVPFTIDTTGAGANIEVL